MTTEVAAQRRAARVAGLLYVLTNATAIFAFSVRIRLSVPGDAVGTMKKIAASEWLFRLGIATELITIAGVILLIAALYIVLQPVSRNVALVAVFWRLAENVVLAVVVLNELLALRLLRQPELAYTFLGLYGDGFRIGFVFLGLGSAVFAWLWFESRYIPRLLAAIGIFGSLLMATVELTTMVVPGVAAAIGMAYMAPMGLFEIGGGLWLLFKGISPGTEP
jgi:hypothetical protein